MKLLALDKIKSQNRKKVINSQTVSEHKEFWNDAVQTGLLFPLWKGKISIPKQRLYNDCGVFSVSYAEIIPTLSNVLSEAAWEQTKLPTMEDIPAMRKAYTQQYMKLVSRKKTIKTPPAGAKGNVACYTCNLLVLHSIIHYAFSLIIRAVLIPFLEIAPKTALFYLFLIIYPLISYLLYFYFIFALFVLKGKIVASKVTSRVMKLP